MAPGRDCLSPGGMLTVVAVVEDPQLQKCWPFNIELHLPGYCHRTMIVVMEIHLFHVGGPRPSPPRCGSHLHPADPIYAHHEKAHLTLA